MSFLLLGNLTLWLTPIWVLSVGVTVGMAILLVLYGLLWLVAPRAARLMPRIIREGVLLPLTYLALALVAFCLLGAPMMPVKCTPMICSGCRSAICRTMTPPKSLPRTP